MAPNKKKKKAVTNMHRGFATVSTVSKNAAIRADMSEVPETLAGPPETLVETSASHGALEAGALDNPSVTAADPELSPEDYERQLGEFELQSLVEKYGTVSRKDAARQTTRLLADRRILRGQATYLNTKPWLSPTLVESILALAASDYGSSGLEVRVEYESKMKAPTEETVIVRLWTLQQVLSSLGFEIHILNEAVQHALRIDAQSGKDTIWGLEEALNWLAIHCDRTKLPDYEQIQRLSIDLSRKGAAQIPVSSEESSRAHSPEKSDVEQPHHLAPKSGRSRSPSHVFVSEKSSVPSAEPKYDSQPESDRDYEPEELVEAYLSTMSRIYALQPDSPVIRSEKQRKGKKASAPVNGANKSTPLSRLEGRLKRITSDILFDHQEAEQLWSSKRLELDKRSAERKKLGLELGSAATSASISAEQSESSQADVMKKDHPREDTGSEEEPLEMLGELFSSIPEEPISEITEQRGNSAVLVTIRKFGKWTGMHPRRVLEESCRSRDPKVRISFSLISLSAFSNRHNAVILWSKDQEVSTEVSIPFLSLQCDSRRITVTMESVSTTTSAESEAYIATAALFLLFSTSPKEEKVYLKLPAVWRDLWMEYGELRKKQADQRDRETLRILQSLARDRENRDAEKGVVLADWFRKRKNQESKSGGDSNYEGQNVIAPKEDHVGDIQRLWKEKTTRHTYGNMLEQRKSLPMWAYKHEVLSAIDKNQVIIVCGETGCGKSTQVPSFILEHELSQGKPCTIYVTEPRRISAISLARRVSEELGENRGDLGTHRSMVGYAIRLESTITKETRLVFATTGIVIRMLERTHDLADVTHLVLDEVHERSIESDFLLIVLRNLMIRRPELKIVLMSATVDAQRFSGYFHGAPVLTVPGRTFPVQTNYLEDAVELTGFSLDKVVNARSLAEDDADTLDEDDLNKGKLDLKKELGQYSPRTRETVQKMDDYKIQYDLILDLIDKIGSDQDLIRFSQAILVFLPGMAEIRRLSSLLLSHPVFSAGWIVHSLHSSIASEDQEQAFLPPPPGFRKVVLATNIAETGITIPDITCVIDTGKHKEMRFDERRQLSRLIESFVSQANAKQRRGRAGRVQEGICFHLYTRARHDQRMAPQQTPEMLRLSLQDLMLRIKVCKIGNIEETLSEALDPPLAKNIRRAIDALVDVKAITAAEELTPLGRQLAKLPLDVYLGKLIILGSIFRCLDTTLTVAAILSSKSPFVTQMGGKAQADVAKTTFTRGESDLLTTWNAYSAWRRACVTPAVSEFQFCKKNSLSSQNLSNIEDLKQQLFSSMVDAGFVALTDIERRALKEARSSSRQRRFLTVPEATSINGENDLIVNSVIAWSFYPKLLVRDGKGWRNVANNQSVSVHPSSVNKRQGSERWLSFYHIMQSSNKFYNAHDTSAAKDFAIALLCGEADFRMFAGVIILDGNRIRFSVNDWKIMVVVKTLRTRLRSIMERSFRSPGKQLTAQQQEWFEIWQGIFTGYFENSLKTKG